MKKSCSMGRRWLIPYFLGETGREVSEQMAAHLNTCADCRQELALLKAIAQTSDEIKRDLEAEAERVDWEDVARNIEKRLGEITASPEATRPYPQRPFWVKWRWVTAGIAVGLVLGFVASFFLLRPRSGLIKEGAPYQVSASFLEKVDEEMARQAVLNYLEKSRQILVALRQSAEKSEELPAPLFSPPSPEIIKDLLLRKKYLTPQLASFRLAKAQAILEEVDGLLLELALIQEKASREEAAKLAQLIEERRLLLKIQLLKHELEESEETT